MEFIAARELRNDVSGVLRRVEAGVPLTVTVSGRPVAELHPVDRRPHSWSWEQFRHVRASDGGLLAELRELAPDTTDDLPEL